MATNTLAQKKQTFSEFMAGNLAKQKVAEVIGGKDGQRFITSIVSAVSTNYTLQNCEPWSILSSAMIGEALKLSPSPQMGHYYLVPYSGKAQFQMGYKGYIQLALRSGRYRDIDAIEIKDGEFKGLDKNTGKPVFEFISDPEQREALAVVGYLAYFETTSGFVKKIYWTRSKMEAHGKKYSKSYNSFWGKDEDGFNGQALKTVLKQLLSRWGLLSIDMQRAIESESDEVLPYDIPSQTTQPKQKSEKPQKTIDVQQSPENAETPVDDDPFADCAE
ncbi:phage recombinase RecT [Candidatus Termititenax aidoneus]|uniref:Phage recombinase RecT n=1 Tax=Termititenax aidoneus TaxID=2218524 RepID=A0A388TDC5_TERA1|nr:phage recombinase RecT [Candidatus Termititenax aidoneus]